MKYRLIRFAAFGLAFLVVLAGLAAWLVPPMLDWNRYRADIAALASFDLGRTVTIDGPVSLSLLPEPILTASRISVASEPNSDDSTTIAVSELRLRLALVPLLSGRVDARELVLRGLDIHLPWPLGPDALSLRTPTWLSSISARIENGSVTVGHVAATHIDANLGLVPETGSTTLGGTAEISGQSWHITTRLTRTGHDGTAGLDLTLDGQGKVQGLGAAFTGQIAGNGALSGRITGRGPDLSRLIAAPAVPFRADGRLSIAAGLAVADNLSVEIAGSPARGAVSLRLEPALRLDVSLAASRLDLDSWLPALVHGAGSRIVASIPTGIDLSSEAATLAGGTLRGLRGSFELTSEGASLRDVAAILPGEARVTLAGKVRPTQPRPAEAATNQPAPQTSAPTSTSGNPTSAPTPGLIFEGVAALTAPNLRTTLGWLESAGLGQLSSLPPGVLRSADLHATVSAETAPLPRIVLTDLTGVVEQSHVEGALTLRPGNRVAVAGNLALDKLSLDPWIPTDNLGLTGLPSRFGKFDIDLQLRADQASFHGQTFAPATADMLLETGRLSLRRLELQTPTARLLTSGVINDTGRITDGRLELTTAADAAGPTLATWLPQTAFIAQHLPRGTLSTVMLASGPPEALTLKINADLGDLHLEAQPVLNLPGGRWSMPLTLRHPGAPRLFDSIGLGSTAAWLGDGSFSWAGSLSGIGPIWAPTRIASDNFDVAAGGLRANGALVLDQTSMPRVTGRINAELLPLPLPYPRSPDPLPIQYLAGWQASVKVEAGQILVGQSPVLQQASAMLSLADGALRLDGLTGKIDGGTLGGSLSFDGAASPPALTADLTLAGATPPGALFELPLDLSGSITDATAKLAANGYSPAALLATLSGTVHLTSKDGVFDGVDLARLGPHLDDTDLRAALAGGTTPFQSFDLQASLTNGAAHIDSSELVTRAGTGTLSGLLDLAGHTMEMRLAVKPAVDTPPEVAVRLSGPIKHVRRTIEISDALRWRAEHPVAPPAPSPAPETSSQTPPSPTPAKAPAPTKPPGTQAP